MSDGVYIPGISSKSNAQSSIDKIMEAKKKKLTKINDSKDSIAEKRKEMQTVGTKVVSLMQKSKALYGVNSPFDDKISNSNDDGFSAKVTKYADVAEHSVRVEQKAKAHRVGSSSLNRSYDVPEGTYKFKISEKPVNVDFEGGDLEKFAKKISDEGKDVIKASITNDTEKTRILVLESVRTGKKNFISFDDDFTKNFFEKIGFFEKVPSFEKNFVLDRQNITVLNGTKTPLINNSKLILRKDENLLYNMDESIKHRDGLVLEVDMKKIDNTPGAAGSRQNSVPNGPDFSETGEAVVYDVQLEGERPDLDIPPYKKPDEIKPQVIVNDDKYLEIKTNKRTIQLDELNVTTDGSKLRFKMPDLIDKDESVTGLVFKNKNTYKEIEVSGIKFVDEDSAGGVKFKRELSKPDDSRIFVDGIEIIRDSNTIDDVLKGVTINLFDKTNGDALLQVDRDYEKMVNGITEFVGEYNSLLKDIYDRIDANKETGEEGVLAKENELKNFISRMRVIMMNSYPTEIGAELSMLNQIGISTNEAVSPGQVKDVNKDKLKGYLEMNEDKFVNKFMEVMEKHPSSVKQLFGSDKNGDFAYDDGVAVQIEKLLKSYTQKSVGFFDIRNTGYTDDIKEKEKEAKEYENKLTEEEQKLKEQFMKMEKAQQELEDGKKKFENFNKGN